MGNDAQRKVGRPATNKQYRKNIVRVSAIEDWVEELIEKVPERSKARTILIEELELFVNKENEKYLNRNGN